MKNLFDKLKELRDKSIVQLSFTKKCKHFWIPYYETTIITRPTINGKEVISQKQLKFWYCRDCAMIKFEN